MSSSPFVYNALIAYAIGKEMNISVENIKKGIENFPESYQVYLQVLKAKYPNWEFSALYTGLDYNDVISNEYANDRNLVPKSYSDSWKCTDPR